MPFSGFLASPLDAQNLTEHSNLQLLHMENLLKVDKMITKLAVVGSAWRTGPAVLNSVGVLEYRFVFSWFLFYEYRMDQN